MNQSQKNCIVISIAQQALYLYQDEKIIRTYYIASAKNGIGQAIGSECTPLGKHHVCEKVGDDAIPNSVFVGRQFTGEIYSEQLAEEHPNRDWILTRILWLEGLEEGLNKGTFNVAKEPVSCDTRQRFIYIHGCPDSHPMKIPSSHGCIKMRNADIIELYDLVKVGVTVDIQS